MHLQVHADDIAPQAWRNGGGRTRELLSWPAGADWTVRISLADIDADGPFSAFPGVERWFVVVQGAGVQLLFGKQEQRMTQADTPLRFDGADAPGCRLLDGPTRDLNLMLRGGTGLMQAVQAGQDWQDAFEQRGLFARVAGHFERPSGGAIELAAHSLLWGLGAGPCRFTPREAIAPGSQASGWWLARSRSAT